MGTLVNVASIDCNNTLNPLPLTVTTVIGSNLGIGAGDRAGFTGFFNVSPVVNGTAV